MSSMAYREADLGEVVRYGRTCIHPCERLLQPGHASLSAIPTSVLARPPGSVPARSYLKDGQDW
jgi:hypothetical protein